MWEGSTSGVTEIDRPYGEFYDFYSVSLENFGYHLVFTRIPHIYDDSPSGTSGFGIYLYRMYLMVHHYIVTTLLHQIFK
jgi:hypothetical protein